MLTFEFPINALLLLAIVAVSIFIGFRFRSRQLAKAHMKLVKAENEMISSHAEILELQKRIYGDGIEVKGIKDPVIVMGNAAQYEGNEKLANGSLRKKLLTKDFTPTRNEGYQLIYNNLLNKEEAKTGS